jgi:hypothetical protein
MKLLIDEANPPIDTTPFLSLCGSEVYAEYFYLTFIWPDVTFYASQQGALACATWPDNCNAFTPFNSKIINVQDRWVPAVTNFEVFKVDHRTYSES